ncbi:1,4-dihydroxy-2-naphthoate prenyltransferase [Streptococcus infantis]|uniref:1,4-dihydroxy-2-naphthoate prenyltransferase n=1 Tax=Streptococcus infantis TaxID=68892 RepID=UPI0039C3C49D
MKAGLRENTLGLFSLFVIFLWLSPNWVNFSFTIGTQSYNWTTFVLFILLPLIGLGYLVLAFFKRKCWLFFFGLACIFAFPITMAVGSFLLGP